jgi:hypothetical protein
MAGHENFVSFCCCLTAPHLKSSQTRMKNSSISEITLAGTNKTML